MVKCVQNPRSNPRLNLQILPRPRNGNSIFTKAEANPGIILLTEAKEKPSFLGKTKAEDSVDHW